MPTWMTEWIWRWWWLDIYLQWAVFLSGVVGASFSAYTWYRTTLQLERLRAFNVNGLRQSVLQMHLITETGIFLCQAILVFVSIGMMQLPAPPIAMYVDHSGSAVLTMLFLRKIARFATSLILLTISFYKMRWMRGLA